MEDVRAVAMHLDATVGIGFRIGVAADMESRRSSTQTERPSRLATCSAMTAPKKPRAHHHDVEAIKLHVAPARMSARTIARHGSRRFFNVAALLVRAK